MDGGGVCHVQQLLKWLESTDLKFFGNDGQRLQRVSNNRQRWVLQIPSKDLEHGRVLRGKLSTRRNHCFGDLLERKD